MLVPKGIGHEIFIDYQLINIHLELFFELYRALCIYCKNDFVQSMENVFGNKVMSKIGFEFTGNNRNILLFLGIEKNVTMAIIMFLHSILRDLDQNNYTNLHSLKTIVYHCHL